MADTPILSLLSTPGVSGIQAGNATQGGNAPAAIPSLPPGTVLSGFILSRDGRGNPILRTDKGDVIIQTDQFLKIGSEVTVRIEQQAGNLRTRILTIDGFPPGQQPPAGPVEDQVLIQTPETPPRSLGQESGQSLFARTASAAAPPLEAEAFRPPAERATFRAVLVQPAPTSDAVMSGLPREVPRPAAPLQQGAAVTIRFVGAELPQPPQESAAANILRGAESARVSGPLATQNSPTPAAVAPQSQQAPSAPAPPLPQGATPPATAPSGPAVTSLATPQALTIQPGNPPSANAPVAGQTPLPAPPTSVTATPVSSASFALPPIPGQTAAQAEAPTAQTFVTTTPGMPPATPATANPPATAAATAPSPPPATPVSGAATPLSQPVQGASLIATVVGVESGELVLNSAVGTLKVPGLADFPPGTRIQLELAALENPRIVSTLSSSPLPSQLAVASEMAHSWQALSNVITALSRVDYAAAQQLLQNVVPQLGPRLGAGILFFISAVRGGDFRSWIGQKNIDRLEQAGQGDVVRKAMSEFGMLRSNFLEQQPGNWQMLFVPLAHGEELHQARLFVKKDGNKEKRVRGREQGNTRFVLEVELSELGPLQMDGFVRVQEQTVGFDLFLRTHQPIPEIMQAEILSIYNNAAELTGFKGQLIFQAAPQFPVNPLDEIVAQRHQQILA